MLLKKIISLSIVCIVVFLLFLLFQVERQSLISEKTKHIDSLIENNSPEKAYEVFKSEYAGKIDEHSQMHLFASRLYKKTGATGIIYCDDSFNQGCYHGFFIEAISAEGLGIVDEFSRICDTKFSHDPTGCHHGIGHGLLEYYGHKNLNKALSFCDNFSWKGKVHGCSSGIFMEYNFPIVKDGDDFRNTLRSFDKTDKFSPCSEVEERYKLSCYHELGDYFINVFNKDYKQAGIVCGEENDPVFKEYCYLGIGYAIPQSLEFVPEKIIDTCSTMPNHFSKVLCLTGASQLLYVDYRGGVEKSREVCSVLYGQEYQGCFVDKYYKGII